MPVTDPTIWAPVLKVMSAARLRLFCFPYAGGGAPVFRAWPEALSGAIELRAIQLPGRGPRLRESFLTNMEVLIETLGEALAPLLDRPFAFFGHSMGALAAFELTRKLQSRNLSPVHLFLSGNNAPQLPDPNPPIHDLPDNLFVEELRSLNGMPQAVLDSKDLLEIVLPAVRSDFTIHETYRYESLLPLECPITVFGGIGDPRTTPAGLSEWQSQTRSGFNQIMLPGNHFFIETARSAILKNISGVLDGEDVSKPLGERTA